MALPLILIPLSLLLLPKKTTAVQSIVVGDNRDPGDIGAVASSTTGLPNTVADPTTSNPRGDTSTVDVADNTNFITALYDKVLGRDPDPDGLAYWVNQLNTNSYSRAAVVNQFLVTSNQEFIGSLYLTYLGRDPDPTGLAYWTNLLQTGSSRDVVSAQFQRGATPEETRDFSKDA